MNFCEPGSGGHHSSRGVIRWSSWEVFGRKEKQHEGHLTGSFSRRTVQMENDSLSCPLCSEVHPVLHKQKVNAWLWLASFAPPDYEWPHTPLITRSSCSWAKISVCKFPWELKPNFWNWHVGIRHGSALRESPCQTLQGVFEPLLGKDLIWSPSNLFLMSFLWWCEAIALPTLDGTLPEKPLGSSWVDWHFWEPIIE